MPPKAESEETKVNVIVQNFNDKKIKKKFDGTTSFAQWKLCAEHVLERVKDDDKKLWTLLDALEGNALFEIQRHQAKERDSAVKVIKLLEAKYADRRTATQIRKQFYDTVQLPGMGMLEFGDAVADSLQGAMAKLSLDAGSMDIMMRDQFAENVTDPALSWELKKKTDAGQCTFDDVRAVALEWESGRAAKTSKPGKQ